MTISGPEAMVTSSVTPSTGTSHVTPLLQVENLVTAFDTEIGRVHAVDGASFAMAPGSTLGIVGESGCGKSVTALSIMGLLPRPSGTIVSGHILFDGKDLPTLSVDQMQAIRGRRMAMIFQEPMTALNPVHRIGSQIIEIYAIHFSTMTKKQRRKAAMTMLFNVGIADPLMVMNNYPHQLSGGMRQRVMIAMALASSPDILIADEPTTALDVTVQAQILELIKALQEKMGMSVMLITHDLGVIAENCDDAVVMYGGKVVERAGVMELFESPAHPYTKGLLSSIPPLSGKPKSLLPTIKGRVPSLDKMPRGCRFSNRCPHVMAICHIVSPAETMVGSHGHFASCYLLGENRD
jgi:oligopeptide/dipeptide ABC transporter ATP-binding protein